MNREAKQEIRRVLMGRTLIAEDGRLIAMEKGQLRMPMGVSDGAGAACFFGIRKKARRLKASCPEQKARNIAASLMQDVGRALYLPQQPEAIACRIRYVLTRPVVLIFDYQEGVPVLSAWTGRGLTGWISVRRALNAFIKRMPKQLTVSEEPAPKDEAEKPKKQKKKNRKGKAGDGGADDTANTREEPINEFENGSDQPRP